MRDLYQPLLTWGQSRFREATGAFTQEPDAMVVEDVAELRGEGYSDQEIVDIAHIVALFSYINDIALGLGMELVIEAVQERQATR